METSILYLTWHILHLLKILIPYYYLPPCLSKFVYPELTKCWLTKNTIKICKEVLKLFHNNTIDKFTLRRNSGKWILLIIHKALKSYTNICKWKSRLLCSIIASYICRKILYYFCFFFPLAENNCQKQIKLIEHIEKEFMATHF